MSTGRAICVMEWIETVAVTLGLITLMLVAATFGAQLQRMGLWPL